MNLRSLKGRAVSLLAQVSGVRAYFEQRRPRDHGAVNHFAGPFLVGYGHAFIEFDLEIDVSWEESRAYRYSKIYYSRNLAGPFTESQVMCFRIGTNRKRHRLRVALPEAARGVGFLVLRFDPFPYASGRAQIYELRPVRENDSDTELNEAARLGALKECTRRAVETSERSQVEIAGHYPESISLEIQPGCNLVCGHCSSHGTTQVHDRHNRMGSITSERLEALAKEVFPHLTLINIVGRGEPLMVSDKLWGEFTTWLTRYRVLFTAVTNGYFIERRITPEVLPFLDTLTVSIDGFSPEIFATNRGQASFEKVMKGVRHFHELRKVLCLPRRPKLCISWTLKKNNIREFPEFVRYIAQYEPDRFYVRHLLLFHEKDAGESLLDVPDLANRYLAEAYELMAQQGIETDCPPLFESPVDSFAPPGTATIDAQDGAPTEAAGIPKQDLACIYIHRSGVLLAGGEMLTCGVQYAAKVGDFGNGTTFQELWNGEVMRNVRRDINTQREWDQCLNCWFRQSRYHEQRSQREQVAAYPLKRMTRFSKSAWDFRGYEDMTR